MKGANRMKKKTKIIALMFSLTMIVGISIIFVHYVKNAIKMKSYEKPFFTGAVTRIGLAIPLTFEYGVQKAKVIVVGKVINKYEKLEDIEAKPGTPEHAVLSKIMNKDSSLNYPVIIQIPRFYVTIEVEKFLKGKADKRLILEFTKLCDNNEDLFKMNPGERFVFMLEESDKPGIWWHRADKRFIFKVNDDNTVYPACWWYDEKSRKRFLNITIEQLAEEIKEAEKVKNPPMYEKLPPSASQTMYEELIRKQKMDNNTSN